MSNLPDKPTLKDINAYKKKLNWGEVPSIYHMASSAIGELDGILTHGFDSAYKSILDPECWNLECLKGFKDSAGNIHVKNKPVIELRHVFCSNNYELHCYPIVEGERVLVHLQDNPLCPFQNWQPETMQMLFRLNSIVPMIVFTFESGDKADMQLIRYAHNRIEALIEILNQSFEIKHIQGFSIAGFCKELYRRRPHFDLTDLLDTED
ncbi:MAG: hypothetical protein KC484_02460 [Colwelliaceae bacterium]|nr:hypothetical protein [Colwelliaceae bacterium]